MDEERTLPRRALGVPVRTVRLEVVEGPDRGRAHVAEGDTVTVGTAQGNDFVLSDATVSRYHLQLGRRADRILVTDLGSTNGTVVGPALLESQSASVEAGCVLGLGATRIRIDDGAVVMLSPPAHSVLGGLRGHSPAMLRLLTTIERVAQSDASVMILGESGSGKELVARAIHDTGPRARQPFVTVDCGSLAPTLFQSELFGHERGAFTGADRRYVGAFERAGGGTLFLDEVGELPPALQAGLLGAIERRRIRRLGGTGEIPVDVRVVSATHRDLRAAVNAAAFRLDLYYRLAVVLIPVPPLRERAQDLPLLVEHFLREAGHDGPVTAVISDALMRELQAQHWPGNVRELRNLVEAALATGQAVTSAGVPVGDAAGRVAGGAPDLIDGVLGQSYREARGTVLAEFERRYLTELLGRAGGNVRRAAQLARMDRSYLIDLLRRHGLS
jgi:DNA-binding NtrC family response regulator